MTHGGMLIALAALLPLAPAQGEIRIEDLKPALTNCLGSMSWKVAQATPEADVPPGLVRGKAVSVKHIAGTNGEAFTYEGTSQREYSCGIAVYGPVTDKLKQEIIGLIDSYKPKWVRDPEDHYKFSDPSAEQTYWGDPFGRGLIGVTLLTRKPSASAPTIEVDYHDIPIQ